LKHGGDAFTIVKQPWRRRTQSTQRAVKPHATKSFTEKKKPQTSWRLQYYLAEKTRTESETGNT